MDQDKSTQLKVRNILFLDLRRSIVGERFKKYIVTKYKFTNKIISGSNLTM